jgi:hypothetical protein
MRCGVPLRVACATLWLAGSGCTALKELPRQEYTAEAEREHVQVETKDGRVYHFDDVRFDADSLYGSTRRDVEGYADEFATFDLALDDVQRIQTRKVDWYRTGLVGGGVIAALVAAGLSSQSNSNGDGGVSPGGPRIP